MEGHEDEGSDEDTGVNAEEDVGTALLTAEELEAVGGGMFGLASGEGWKGW